MIVLLGEVGGVEEYDVCEALRDGRINKPLVAWCIGTCAGLLYFYHFKIKLNVSHWLIVQCMESAGSAVSCHSTQTRQF
jgi:succinyl-CoA synthetase alpha subunit